MVKQLLMRGGYARGKTTPSQHMGMRGKRKREAGHHQPCVDEHKERRVGQLTSDERARESTSAYEQRQRSLMHRASNVKHSQQTSEYYGYPLEHLRPIGGSVILNRCAIIGRAHPRLFVRVRRAPRK